MRSPAGEKYQRPFLKWAGNKFRILPQILDKLPEGSCLIEPFAGSGAVFLNTDYEKYLVNDINADLINLYKTLQLEGMGFITYARQYFTAENNVEEAYYRLRQRFNTIEDAREKSALLIYLNRHGYNGLVRYNAGGGFNVPFGRYKKPYFPLQEMQVFHAKSKYAEFICTDFEHAMGRAGQGAVIYADPPYVPLSKTSNFTGYAGNRFGEEQQIALANKAESMANKGVTVLISNHDTPFTERAYRNAQLTRFPVQRYISCKGEKRVKVNELLAVYGPGVC